MSRNSLSYEQRRKLEEFLRKGARNLSQTSRTNIAKAAAEELGFSVTVGNLGSLLTRGSENGNGQHQGAMTLDSLEEFAKQVTAVGGVTNARRLLDVLERMESQ